MATGTVKWFNNAKGYGFVLSEDKAEDLFIHYSSIQMDGYKSLKAGQEVQYDVQEGPKGMHAVNIRSVAEVPDRQDSETGDPATEDNLHLNPMHGLPENKSSPTSRVESPAPEKSTPRETEAAVD